MATTTNFGWETPDDTDLVKDGAAAIRTALGGVDTSFVDLKGGTTGQVLSKASNTDLDFTWVADATGIPATIFDAKGDIIAATAADTASRLAVGTNGQVLTADSTTATGLKWAAAAGGGKLLQVVQGSITGSASTTSDTLVDTGLSVTITPSASTSKVLLFVVHNSVRSGGANNSDGAYFALFRASTNICAFAALVGYTNSTLRQDGLTASVMYLDSPATTSATTYKTQYRSEISGNAVYTNSRSPSYSTIVAFEIGA